MCKVKKVFIPDKHRAFWDTHYNDILFDCGHDYSIFMQLMAIRP